MRDLQRRLGAAGFASAGLPPLGEFCSETIAALHRFQHARGLRSADVCNEECWKALVEASWKLGDRLLVLTSPNQRGDDVADLQGLLARLGFDCGRVDGIFGPRTARAVEDFQSNCGVLADGACGSQCVQALNRVASQSGSGPGITTVREREALRQAPTTLESLRVVVGQFGGLSTITRAVAHELRVRGAMMVSLDEPDPVLQARIANEFDAHLYVGFDAVTALSSAVYFYKVPTFESFGGHTLATCLTSQLTWCGLATDQAQGTRVPVLRETRMPAVLCELAPIRLAVDSAHRIGRGVVRSIEQWMVICSLVP